MAFLMAGAAAGLAQTPATTLPTLKVETTKQPKVVRKARPKRTAPPKVEPEPAPPPAPAETATGPVKDYVATRSATGTKTDTPLAEIPQSISVVGKEQMRDTGVQTLQGAIRFTPGVLADAFGFDSRSDYSVIRGVQADLFIDGLRTSYGYYVNRAKIEPYALERIEVLRGPSSMLYGQSSAGGIINGVSKLPQAIPYGEVGFDYGSFDFKQMKFDVTGPATADGKWLYRLTALGRNADTEVDFVADDRYMLQPSLTYRPTNDTSITLLANLRKDHSGSTQQFLPQLGTLTPHPLFGRVPRNAFMGEPGDYYDTEQQSVTLLFDHEFSDALSMHHGMRYTHTDVAYDSTIPAILSPARFFALEAMLGIDLDESHAPFLSAGQSQVARVRFIEEHSTDVFNSDTNFTARFDTNAVRHKVTGGFDYTRFSTGSARANLLDNLLPGQPTFDIFNPVYGQLTGFYLDILNGVPVAPSDVTLKRQPDEVQSQAGLYIQDQLRFGPWIAVLGARQDWLTIEFEGEDDAHEQATTVRGALMYETSFGLTPYISYSESFTPQPGQIVDDAIFFQFDPRPAGPRRGEQVEVGVKYQPKGANFAVNAALYDLKESNLVVSPDTLFNSLGGASTRVRGFEIEALGRITPELKVVAAYTYMDAKWESYPEPLDFPPGIFDVKVGTQVEGAPRHMASLWGIYTFNDGSLSGLSLGAGVRYVGSTTDVAPDILTGESIVVKTPSFTLFDAMVAYETEDWRWQLSAQNLEDEYYVVSCTAFRGDCGVGQGRTVITSFTYKF